MTERPAPYYEDDSVTLYLGDALVTLCGLPDGSVDCCVTSPPYFGLRDYGVEGQYGLEASPAEYVETMRQVFAEVRRVLADDGTLWLNIGDSFSASKRLIGVPWRVALALSESWTLRNEVIWNKTNGMPDSARDRLTVMHEHVFMFSKGPTYWFDLDPIRLPHLTDRPIIERDFSQRAGQWAAGSGGNHRASGPEGVGRHPLGRNPGDVWSVATQPFSEAHFAVMPQALAERAILAGCKPGGVVLDPFSGSGTTGLAAAKHGRKYVGVDLNADYLDLSLKTRLAQPGIDFGGVA